MGLRLRIVRVQRQPINHRAVEGRGELIILGPYISRICNKNVIRTDSYSRLKLLAVARAGNQLIDDAPTGIHY